MKNNNKKEQEEIDKKNNKKGVKPRQVKKLKGRALKRFIEKYGFNPNENRLPSDFKIGVWDDEFGKNYG